VIYGFRSFVLDLIKARRLIMELARCDYKQINQGSYLGIVWSYLQPLLFIAVLYSVFKLGFRTGADTGRIPFSICLGGQCAKWRAMQFSDN
jgi:ABC-type polysaccharide/polyol phosphate export permease